MLLVEIKDFNALIINKLFLDQPAKKSNKRVKKFMKYQEMMTVQQEIYQIICIIKNIINFSL